MTGIYYPQIAELFTAAGLTCRETNVSAGWQRRARSSGGFPVVPLGVQWHHTASNTAPENDVAWQVTGSGNPIGNMLIDRNGDVWMIAAGAANTAGQGGPLTLSRGTVPADQANTRTWAIEFANSGTGQAWPRVQVDAGFIANGVLNDLFGNRPDDLFTHALGAGDGWTSRKVDPAVNDAVQGPWQPGGITSSRIWLQADIRAEAMRRAVPTPPTPTPPEDDDMRPILTRTDDGLPWLLAPDLSWRYLLTEDLVGRYSAAGCETWNGLDLALVSAIPPTTLAGEWPFPWAAR